MKLQVKFICHTCVGYNKHQRDGAGFITRETEFDSFSDAIKHYNLADYDHNIDAYVVDVKLSDEEHDDIINSINPLGQD